MNLKIKCQRPDALFRRRLSKPANTSLNKFQSIINNIIMQLNATFEE